MLESNQLPLNIYPSPASIVTPTAVPIQLSQEQIEFKVSQGYFSSILVAQLEIFILIVTILVAFSFYLQYRTNKAKIGKEVSSETKKMKKDMKKEFSRKVNELDKNISKKFDDLEMEVGVTRGEIYRNMAQFWDSQKSYSTAFIWWIRAAYEFSKVGDQNLTKITLGNASESASQVQSAIDLTPDNTAEYQKLTSQIDDKLYKVEKDSLDQAMKTTLSKTIQ